MLSKANPQIPKIPVPFFPPFPRPARPGDPRPQSELRRGNELEGRGAPAPVFPPHPAAATAAWKSWSAWEALRSLAGGTPGAICWTHSVPEDPSGGGRLGSPCLVSCRRAAHCFTVLCALSSAQTPRTLQPARLRGSPRPQPRWP